MEYYVIINAGGVGNRMQSKLPKQFIKIGDKSMLEHSIQAFYNHHLDFKLIVILNENYFHLRESIQNNFPNQKIYFAKNGETRFHSTKNGLEFCHGHSIILVHDAVRPLIDSQLIDRVVSCAKVNGSAIPVVEVKDSIRKINLTKNESVDRSFYKIVQTPQGFNGEILLKSFELNYKDTFTDEASVVENAGHEIHLCEGHESNIKITTPIDLKIIEFYFSSKI